MQLPRAFYQPKFGSELILQTCGTVPDDLQSAASRGSFQRERRHDHIPVTSHRVAHGLHIPAAFLGLREKMKHGSVMPHVIPVTRQLDSGDVRLDPLDRSRTSAESLPGKRERRSSKIEDRDVLIAFRKELINECGSPTANINDLSRFAGSSRMDQLQREVRVLLVPRELGRSQRLVNSFPMRLGIHMFTPGSSLALASDLPDLRLLADPSILNLRQDVPFPVFTFLFVALAARVPFLEKFER
jgi:hypothetical protein